MPSVDVTSRTRAFPESLPIRRLCFVGCFGEEAAGPFPTTTAVGARASGRYDTIIRTGASDLSAGERQRVAIARAFLQDSPILVLDEGFSNLDLENQGKILHELNKMKSGKSILIVTHKLRSILSADRVVAVKDGQVIECGTPAELLSQKQEFFSWVGSDQNELAVTL